MAIIVTGVREVAGAFLTASETTHSRVVEATEAAAKQMATAQRQSAPVLSGRTRRSIGNSQLKVKGGYGRSIGPLWFVSRFLVFGTVKMSPRWDLFGASLPAQEAWESDLRRVAGKV
jgi:hypothetical protein